VKSQHLLRLVLPVGLFVMLCAGIVRAQVIPPAEDIAAQVRTQGYPCEGSASALKLVKQSWPDEPLWILTCTNATYRVRLIPDMAAKIERVQ